MLVRCWGSRGSVPVSGKEYMKYGGDTTCIEVVSSSGEILIIDAGTGIRKLGNRLQREGLNDINDLYEKRLNSAPPRGKVRAGSS